MKISNKRVVPIGLNIKINDVLVSKVDYAKFLGILIDDNLNFKHHVNEICTKLSQVIGVLNRLSDTVPMDCKMLIYRSLICSKIDYCITVYGSSNLGNIQKIDRLLSKAKKIVTFSGNNDRVSKLEFDFHLKFVYAVCIRTHKILNGYSENNCYIRKVSNLMPNHSYCTRHRGSNAFNTPFYRKSISQKSFVYNSIKYYNILPLELKSITSKAKFKQVLIQLLNGDIMNL